MMADVLETRQETHDVKTLRLKPEKEVKFTPGQYALFSIPGNEKVKGAERPFTFASSPSEKEAFEITVKEMGSFTHEMHHLEKGDALEFEGPRGESLNFDEPVKGDVVFLAGGSGITPFMSALRYALAKELQNRFFLLFSNRTEKDIIFRSELESMNGKGRVKVVHALSEDQPKGWEGEKGRIDRRMIERHVPKPMEKVWYICGPPPMVDAMKEILEGMGIDAGKIRFEKWQIPGKHGKEK